MRIIKSKIILPAALTILFSACEYLFPSLPGDKVTVEQAYNYIKKHQGDEDLVLLDVRTKEEYDKARLPNAVLIDYKQVSFPSEIEKLDKNKTYLIYSGDDYRSANTFELMKELRFKNIHYIIGGIDQWQKQNFPLN
jgi:rhodanese-related sulfurtransferase